MKNIWSIIASRTIIDKSSNMLSIFDCIEQININSNKDIIDKNKIKNIPAKFEIISFWKDDEINKKRHGEFIIELYDPNDKKINEFKSVFMMPKTMKNMRTIITFEGLPITIAGEYIFKIKFRENANEKYRQVSELPLEVIFDDNSKIN